LYDVHLRPEPPQQSSQPGTSERKPATRRGT